MTAQIVADGFTVREDEPWRKDLPVTAKDPYPSTMLHLTAEAQDPPVLARSIKATYSTGGQTMGFAVRPIAVVRDASLLDTAPRAAPEPAQDVALATEWEPPTCLTIRIHRGVQERAGRLLWTFESPHPVTLPKSEANTDIGEIRSASSSASSRAWRSARERGGPLRVPEGQRADNRRQHASPRCGRS